MLINHQPSEWVDDTENQCMKFKPAVTTIEVNGQRIVINQKFVDTLIEVRKQIEADDNPANLYDFLMEHQDCDSTMTYDEFNEELEPVTG